MGATEFFQLSGTIGLTGAFVFLIIKEMFAALRERRDRPAPSAASQQPLVDAIDRLSGKMDNLLAEAEENGKQLAYIQGQLSGGKK